MDWNAEGVKLFSNDENLNYALNRWYNFIGRESYEDILKVGSSSQNLSEYIDEFIKLGEKRENEGEIKKAAFYYRAAEFYMKYDDCRKENYRKKFINLISDAFDIEESQREKIPYENANIYAYKFLVNNSKGTIVIFGGYDSYIEELIEIIKYLNQYQYSVIAFDGPGQGSTLEESKLKMDFNWDKVLKSILDYFDLKEVTLIGMSLGGILALQAAAFEKRIKQVVAFDVMYSLFDCILSASSEEGKEKIKTLLKLQEKSKFNSMMEKFMSASIKVYWSINQGMHVMGVDNPYDYFIKIQSFNTEKISALVNQDVLLMAGTNDNYVPLEMLYMQMQVLTNAKSIEARVFTANEHAEGHCQLTNLKLALDVIINWINFSSKKDGCMLK